MRIRLRDYMPREDGWGHDEGRLVYSKLLSLVEANPATLVFAISLEGVRRTDASFPRESVVELAKRYRGFRGFCLVDVPDQDLLDNWEAAATKRVQPIVVWDGDKYRIIGPPPSEGNHKMFNYVSCVPSTTAGTAASALDYLVPNASNKLKQLWLEGYILRRERTAPSGGVEFEYFRIK